MTASDAAPAGQAIALLLLAAGRARRFGRNKLAEPVAGRPLCQHAALAFAGQEFARRIAVVGASDHGLAELGFECLRVPPGEAAMSVSIATGMQRVAGDKALGAVLIALGDMPLIAPSHVERMLDAFDGTAVASALAGRPQPPALFGRCHFAALARLEGDKGARDLLANARLVEADPVMLSDVDTAADFARVRRLLEQANR